MNGVLRYLRISVTRARLEGFQENRSGFPDLPQDPLRDHRTFGSLPLLASGEVTGEAIDIAKGDVDGLSRQSPGKVISSRFSGGSFSRHSHWVNQGGGDAVAICKLLPDQVVRGRLRLKLHREDDGIARETAFLRY